MNWKRTTALLCVLFFVCPAFAYQKALGWRVYNEPKEAKPALPKKELAPVPENKTTRVMSATEQLEWFQKQHKEAKAAATIDPRNKEKVKRLVELNQYIASESSKIGMTFKQILVEHPELSYTLEHPTEQSARQPYLAELKTKRENKVREMARKGWGLFFIYEGGDSITKQLAPSIQAFADDYDLELLGISDDGNMLSAIRENKPNNGKFSPQFTPALLLVNPNTKEIKPLSYGFISKTKLLQRFYNVATNFSQSNY